MKSHAETSLKNPQKGIRSRWVSFFVQKGERKIMVATGPTNYDGHIYQKGEEIPDLGSFVATSVDGHIRGYEGLSADIEKLPQYDDLGTGSSAFCVDTGQLFKYEATTKTWYEI